MPRENQFSVYLDPPIAADLDKLLQRYPTQSRSAFVAAAVKFYLPYALRGIDGNLMPYILGNKLRLDPDLNTAKLRNLVRDVLREETGSKDR